MPPSAAPSIAAALLISAPMLAMAGQAFAQPDKPTVIDIKLSEFRFAPAQLELAHGQTYLLRLTNDGKHAHDLSAKDFFKAAALGPDTSAKIKNGDIDVPEGQTVEVALTPSAPGTYEMHCARPMHSMLGMKGQIVVR
jgi:plastocyanin